MFYDRFKWMHSMAERSVCCLMATTVIRTAENHLTSHRSRAKWWITSMCLEVMGFLSREMATWLSDRMTMGLSSLPRSVIILALILYYGFMRYCFFLLIYGLVLAIATWQQASSSALVAICLAAHYSLSKGDPSI